jgi:hypothetical protein
MRDSCRTAQHAPTAPLLPAQKMERLHLSACFEDDEEAEGQSDSDQSQGEGESYRTANASDVLAQQSHITHHESTEVAQHHADPLFRTSDLGDDVDSGPDVLASLAISVFTTRATCCLSLISASYSRQSSSGQYFHQLSADSCECNHSSCYLLLCLCFVRMIWSARLSLVGNISTLHARMYPTRFVDMLHSITYELAVTLPVDPQALRGNRG